MLYRRYLKRVLDIVASASLLFSLFPILAVICLSLFVLQGWPIIFVQPRVGLGGVVFNLYKFRSMHLPNASQTWSYQTEKNDQRITAVGKLLRLSSLDELPQLCNILKGDMSLVGPRPCVPEQRQRYTEEEWSQRVSVRPGLTGLAQVNGRSTSSQAQRILDDVCYVRTISLVTDLKVIAKTFTLLFKRVGN